jgi:probable rRNA maturation factor
MIFTQTADVLLITGSPPTGVNQLLEQAAQEALRLAAENPQADLTIVLSDDRQLHELNLQFLGIDAPTDVLSFPAGDTDPDSEQTYLGDVIISLPRAAAQAAAGGHPVEAELQLLCVHGVLHLLGYDHATPEEKTEMWAVQAQVLSNLGSPITSPRDETEL